MTATPRPPRLDSMIRCRRELSRLYGEARAGRLDPKDATRLASIVSMIGRMIDGSEIEARIGALERRAGGQ